MKRWPLRNRIRNWFYWHWPVGLRTRLRYSREVQKERDRAQQLTCELSIANLQVGQRNMEKQRLGLRIAAQRRHIRWLQGTIERLGLENADWQHKAVCAFSDRVAADSKATALAHGLKESLMLQAHYADLLNMHDGGQRIIFRNVEDWLARLAETATDSEASHAD